MQAENHGRPREGAGAVRKSGEKRKHALFDLAANKTTIAGLAKLCGISHTAMSQWLAGRRIPEEYHELLERETGRSIEELYSCGGKAGWTITSLARALYTSRPGVWEWFQNRKVPEHWVDRVCDVTGLRPGDVRPDLADHYYEQYLKFYDGSYEAQDAEGR